VIAQSCPSENFFPTTAKDKKPKFNAAISG